MDSQLITGKTIQELNVVLKKFLKDNPGISQVQQSQILPIQTITPNNFAPQQPTVSFEFHLIIIYKEAQE